jgi:hypothetical protein
MEEGALKAQYEERMVLFAVPATDKLAPTMGTKKANKV